MALGSRLASCRMEHGTLVQGKCCSKLFRLEKEPRFGGKSGVAIILSLTKSAVIETLTLIEQPQLALEQETRAYASKEQF